MFLQNISNIHKFERWKILRTICLGTFVDVVFKTAKKAFCRAVGGSENPEVK